MPGAVFNYVAVLLFVNSWLHLCCSGGVAALHCKKYRRSISILPGSSNQLNERNTLKLRTLYLVAAIRVSRVLYAFFNIYAEQYVFDSAIVSNINNLSVGVEIAKYQINFCISVTTITHSISETT